MRFYTDEERARLKTIMPKELFEAAMLQKPDQGIIIDRKYNLADFLQNHLDLKGKDRNIDMMGILKKYNEYIFNFIDLVKATNTNLSRANEGLSGEIKYLCMCSAEYITILKNYNIDVPKIQKDMRKKLDEQLAKNKANTVNKVNLIQA